MNPKDLAEALLKFGLHHIYWVISYRYPDQTELLYYKDTDPNKAADYVWYLQDEGFVIVETYQEQCGKRLK